MSSGARGNRAPWIVTTIILALLAAASVAAGAYLYDQLGRTKESLAGSELRGGAEQLTIDRLTRQQKDLQQQLQAAQAEAKNPTVGIWNDCGGSCAIQPGSYRVGTIPDTFTYHLKLTSDVSVDAYFLTVEEYARFYNCPSYIRPSAGQNRIAACAGAWALNGQVPGDRFASGNAVNFDFHLAEGCASYLVVMFPSAAGETADLHPDVSVSYQPAAAPTGECAQG